MSDAAFQSIAKLAELYLETATAVGLGNAVTAESNSGMQRPFPDKILLS